ncbi:MAG: hypothetical protein ABH818_01425 [Patescibacteria group bacterium]
MKNSIRKNAIISLLLLLVLSGCSGGKDSIKRLNRREYVSFINNYTLLPPIKEDVQFDYYIDKLKKDYEEFINSKDKDSLFDSGNTYAVRLFGEKSFSGINLKESMDWYHVSQPHDNVLV